ncbi:MAG: hypothetical protein J6X30_01610 [Clostridia bacterium]|nr:hypothetical protein [Clostridia bacterium]
MIQIIYGKKGAGKTKKIIESANHASETLKGNVAFLFNSKRYICDLKHQVRFINTEEYGIKGAYLFFGFICGLVASNFDLERIYVDGFLKHMDRPMEELEDLFIRLKSFCEQNRIELILSVSADKDEIPAFMQEFLIN